MNNSYWSDEHFRLCPRFFTDDRIYQVERVYEVFAKNNKILKRKGYKQIFCALLYNSIYRQKRSEDIVGRRKELEPDNPDIHVPSKSIYIALSPRYYSNPEKYWGYIAAIVLKNSPYITYRRMRNILSIFYKSGLIKFSKGFVPRDEDLYGNTILMFGDAMMSEFSLKSITEWNWPEISKDARDYLEIVSIYKNISASHKQKTLDEILCKDLKKNTSAITKVQEYLWNWSRAPKNKITGKYIQIEGLPSAYIPASEEKISEVDKLNSFLIKNNLEQLRYTRSYVGNEYNYGRLFSTFNGMKKEYREILYNIYGYKELDFDNFNFNLFSLIMTGRKSSSCMYRKIVRTLFKYVRIPKQYYTKEIVEAYRDVIKKCVLTIAGGHSLPEVLASIRGKFLSAVNPDKTENKDGTGLWSKTTFFPPEEMHKEDLLIRTGKLLPRRDKKEFLAKFKTNIRWRDFLRDKGYSEDLPMIRLNEKDLLTVLKKALPDIFPLLFSGLNGFCQNIESNIAVRMGNEMVSKGVYPLIVHDAYIVPTEHADYFDRRKEEILLEEYKKVYINKADQKKEFNQASYDMFVSDQVITNLLDNDEVLDSFEKFKLKVKKASSVYLKSLKKHPGKSDYLKYMKDFIKNNLWEDLNNFKKICLYMKREKDRLKTLLLEKKSNNRIIVDDNLKSYKLLRKREYLKDIEDLDEIGSKFLKNFLIFLFFRKLNKIPVLCYTIKTDQLILDQITMRSELIKFNRSYKFDLVQFLRDLKKRLIININITINKLVNFKLRNLVINSFQKVLEISNSYLNTSGETFLWPIRYPLLE